MSLNINKIDKKHIRYIEENYAYKTAEEISKEIGLPPHQIRDIARQRKITKRITSDILYPDDNVWSDIYYPNMSFSNYEISTNGHIRRKQDHVAIQWTFTHDRYSEVKLVNDYGKRMTLRVHRLVAETFEPVRVISQIEVNHIDGNKQNNSIDNLEWVTPSENQLHSYRLGLRKPANLKHDLDTQITEVCRLISDGLTNNEIIDLVDFDISNENIQNIRKKRTHKKISDKFF